MRKEEIMGETNKLESEVKRLSVKAKCRNCGEEYEYDNPFWDCTDGAHPAWWRGETRGFYAALEKINQFLDGDIDLINQTGNKQLCLILKRISAIGKENKELKEVIWQIVDYGGLGEVLFYQSGRFPHMVKLLEETCEKFNIQYERMGQLIVKDKT
mgnify:CR=1 FL=1